MVFSIWGMNINNRRRFASSNSVKGEQEFADIVRGKNDELDHQGAAINLSSSNDASINSSYADLFEASGVVIRDYEGSFSRGNLISNPVTYNLNKCKSKVVVPYYKLLCLIAWRPFGKLWCCSQWIVDLWNILYTIIFFGILFFWYFIRVYTCQGSLILDHAITTIAPTTMPPPTIPPNTTALNWTDTIPSNKVLNASHVKETSSKAFVDPCQHVFGTYIVPSTLHFFAFLIGFYHFRIQEHEGLYVLMEKVYLQSVYPDKITKHLRIYLLFGLFWLFGSGTVSYFYLNAFGFERGTGISSTHPVEMYTMAGGIILTGMFASCVNLAVVLSYCGQCQLLRYYIDGVIQRLEEKSTELKQAMKDILDIKRHFNRLNGSLSFSMSCVVFDLFIVVAITSILLFNYRATDTYIWWYRVCVFMQWGSMLAFVLIQASLLTSSSKILKEKALAIRVFGYQSYTQFDIDSFLNFLSLTELQAELFTIPVKPRYLWGCLILSLQILILVFQTGRVITDSKWI